MTDPSYIYNPDSHITIAFANGENHTIYANNDIFNELVDAVKGKKWTDAYDIITAPVARVVKAVEQINGPTEGGVTIEHGVVYVDGVAVENVITDRIIRMADEGFDVQPMKAFLGRLMQNPSFRAVKELYGFLEATNLPITDDGHFLAYKKIRSDYTDCHTGKFDNSIGTTVQMARNKVNDDKHELCSSGLHFCGRQYLRSFGGERTVMVKIDPADVVSIPTDYNNAKGRACKYVVIQELDIDDSTNEPVTKLEDKSVRTQNVEPTNVVTKRVASLDRETGQIDTEYDSLEDAAKWTGIRKEYIERVLSGDRASTGGYGWKYLTVPTNQFDVSDLDEEEETDIDYDDGAYDENDFGYGY